MKIPFTFWNIASDDVNERSDLWLLNDELWILSEKADINRILDNLELGSELDEDCPLDGFEGDGDIYALDFREITDECRYEFEKILVWKWWVLTKDDFWIEK